MQTITNPATQSELFIPGFAVNVTSKHAMSSKDLRKLGVYLGIVGGARGTNAEGDVVTQTVDGRDLNDLWAEFQATIALQNAERQRLIDLLTFPVNNVIEDVPQFSSDDFEVATEWGVPKGMRATQGVFSLGYDFEWYDVAARFTWKFLADATAAQVQAVNAAILEADNRNVFLGVMRAIFKNVTRVADIKGQNYNVYPFYNNDGTVPPKYKSNTFDGTHTHYLTSGAATVDSGDFDACIDHLTHHGYQPQNGTTIFIMVNPAQGAMARTFRVANGSTADFIPAPSEPTLILPADTALVGGRPPDTYRGFNVIGSYRNCLIIEEDYIPAGYLLTLGSGGPANLNNPVGIREHSNPALRGLRLVKGANPDYPIIDSYYQRGFGTGIRQRGEGVVMQVTASATYTPPSVYA